MKWKPLIILYSDLWFVIILATFTNYIRVFSQCLEAMGAWMETWTGFGSTLPTLSGCGSLDQEIRDFSSLILDCIALLHLHLEQAAVAAAKAFVLHAT